MSLAYKLGEISGKLLCRVGLQNAVVKTVDGLDVFFNKFWAFCFALTATVGFLYGLHWLYESFKDDFSKAISINAIAEALILLVAVFVGGAIVNFAWANLFTKRT